MSFQLADGFAGYHGRIPRKEKKALKAFITWSIHYEAIEEDPDISQAEKATLLGTMPRPFRSKAMTKVIDKIAKYAHEGDPEDVTISNG